MPRNDGVGGPNGVRKTVNQMEENMHRRTLLLTIASLTIGLMGDRIYAEERNDPALIKSMADVKVTLQEGLTAAAQQGKPISAKFELEDGKLQLSVYTENAGKFSEVIVDYTTGKVAKTLPRQKRKVPQWKGLRRT